MTSGRSDSEQLDGLVASGRLRADPHVRFERDDAREPQANQVMVVDEHEPEVSAQRDLRLEVGAACHGHSDRHDCPAA